MALFLFSGLAKKQKYAHVYRIFQVFLVILKIWLFFSKMADKHHTKAIQQYVFSQCFKGTTIKLQFFLKSAAIEDKPNCRYISKTFSTKDYVLWKKLWLFGLFSGDKGDYIDAWMIKITIETNQIDMYVCFFRRWITC